MEYHALLVPARGGLSLLRCARVDDPKPAVADQAPARAVNGAPARSRLGLVFALLFAVVGLAVTPPARWSLDGFVELDDRAPTDRALLWLSPAAGQRTSADALRAAALAIGTELGDARVPLAPPPADLDAWLDAHALYLLPTSEHERLVERLDQDAMLQSVQALQARLSSPLFGVAGEEARRDPLGLRPLLAPFMETSAASWPSGATVTPTGDLLSADGQQLVLEIRGDDLDTLEARARSAVEAESMAAGVENSTEGAGSGSSALDIQRLSFAGVPAPPAEPWHAKSGLALLAAFALGLILARRDLLRCALALLCASAGLFVGAQVGAPWMGEGSELAPFSQALLALAFAVALGVSASILNDARPPASTSVLLAVSALAPALALPYPYARGLLGPWATAIVTAAVLAEILRRLRPPRTEPAIGAALAAPVERLRPVAIALVIAGSALTVLVAARVPARGLGSIVDQERAAGFATAFFEPQLVLRAVHEGPDPTQALEGAAAAQHALETLKLDPIVGDEILKFDGAGAYVLAPDTLAERRAGLAELGLRGKMQTLRNMLEQQGFHPDAFTEFLTGAADTIVAPDTDAAIAGTLGPWIRGRLVDPTSQGPAPSDDDAQYGLISRVHLRAPVAVPPLRLQDDALLRLHGPATHIASDSENVRLRLALAWGAAAWWIALLAWLRHRSLANALFVAAAATTGAGLGLATTWWDGAVHDATSLIPLAVIMSLCAFEANEALRRDAHAARGPAVFARTVAIVIGSAWMAAQADPWVHRWGLATMVGVGLGGGLAYFAARFGSPEAPALNELSSTSAPSDTAPREGASA